MLVQAFGSVLIDSQPLLVALLARPCFCGFHQRIGWLFWSAGILLRSAVLAAASAGRHW